MLGLKLRSGNELSAATGPVLQVLEARQLLSVSIKSNFAGTSPTTINLAEDLISILAFGENVWLIVAALCRCQLVGFNETKLVVVLVAS